MPGRPTRTMTLSAHHLARVAREVPDPGPLQEYTLLSDVEMEAVAQRLLHEVRDDQFWLFAYGSLIWKPEFEHVEARRGVVHGWRRSFCIEIRQWRATPAQPGLILALERGGACTGVAYRMPGDEPFARMMRLLHREISYHEDLEWLRWLTVRAGGELFRALAFYCAPPDDPDVVRLTLDQQAERLAQAVGHAGSCAEYLHNTVSHLEALGIRDPYLWALQRRVAEEIDRL